MYRFSNPIFNAGYKHISPYNTWASTCLPVPRGSRNKVVSRFQMVVTERWHHVWVWLAVNSSGSLFWPVSAHIFIPLCRRHGTGRVRSRQTVWQWAAFVALELRCLYPTACITEPTSAAPEEEDAMLLGSPALRVRVWAGPAELLRTMLVRSTALPGPEIEVDKWWQITQPSVYLVLCTV